MNKKKVHRQCWKVQNFLSRNLEVLEFFNREKSYGYDVPAHECLPSRVQFSSSPVRTLQVWLPFSRFGYSIEVMHNCTVFAASHNIILHNTTDGFANVVSSLSNSWILE